MKPSERPLPPIKVTDDDESFETTQTLPIRMALSVAARSLLGISLALNRIADTVERDSRAAYLDRPE